MHARALCAHTRARNEFNPGLPSSERLLQQAFQASDLCCCVKGFCSEFCDCCRCSSTTPSNNTEPFSSSGGQHTRCCMLEGVLRATIASTAFAIPAAIREFIQSSDCLRPPRADQTRINHIQNDDRIRWHQSRSPLWTPSCASTASTCPAAPPSLTSSFFLQTCRWCLPASSRYSCIKSEC